MTSMYTMNPGGSLPMPVVQKYTDRFQAFSNYLSNLKRYLKYVPPENLFLGFYEDILFHQNRFMAALQEFLDVPEEDIWQWFVISHPNYAPEIKLIEVEDEHITEVEIVLKKGGTVEGYAYDANGQPLSDSQLCFMDESHFNYWKENRARLGSTTTDSNGFYRITGLPQKLCYGFRYEPDEQLGVVCTAILPKNGKINKLDFVGVGNSLG